MTRSKYRILGQVGQGQYGQVYCGVERSTGQFVALKDLSYQRSPTRQFLREIRVLVSLQHPNIVGFRGLEYDSPRRYLVMDYCEGGTLRDLIEREVQLPLGERIQLVTDILQGLIYAHGHGVIHCDLKPENILLNLGPSGWVARITDLGVARLEEELGQVGIGKGYTGPPAYMAPERFYGQYSQASDLYAVGILLYELVMGERPFVGMPGELMKAHLNQSVVIPDDIPFPLRSIISTALEKLPQHRFKSAEEMLKSVQLAIEVLQSTPSEVPVTGVYSQAPSFRLLEGTDQQPCSHPIRCLAADSDQVYLGIEQRVDGWTHTGGIGAHENVQSHSVELDEPVIQLKLCPQGCFALTRSQQPPIHYSLYFWSIGPSSSSQQSSDDLKEQPHSLPLDNREPFILKTWQSQDVEFAIDPQGQRLAIADHQSSELFQATLPAPLTIDTIKFERLHPPTATSTQLPVESSSAQLIALDNHWVVRLKIPPDQATTPEYKTILRRFDQQGECIDYRLPIALEKVIPSAGPSQTLLAIQQTEPTQGLLINLQPWKISPVTLALQPTLETAAPWGYVLTNSTGQILLLDHRGTELGNLELPVTSNEQVTAVCTFAESGVIVATWSSSKGMLYITDVKDLLQASESS